MQYFINYYQQDKAHKDVVSEVEYLQWVKRFYYGSALYSRGWKQATAEAVATMKTRQDKRLVEEKMIIIGDIVAPEWSKDRDYRVINTRHIVIWGNALAQSFATGEQIKVIDSVYADAQALLQRKIKPGAIKIERYITSLPITDEELLFQD